MKGANAAILHQNLPIVLDLKYDVEKINVETEKNMKNIFAG
jgi:hypothetical protein